MYKKQKQEQYLSPRVDVFIHDRVIKSTNTILSYIILWGRLTVFKTEKTNRRHVCLTIEAKKIHQGFRNIYKYMYTFIEISLVECKNRGDNIRTDTKWRTSGNDVLIIFVYGRRLAFP